MKLFWSFTNGLKKAYLPPITTTALIKKDLKPKPINVHLEINQLFSEINAAELDFQDIKKLENILIEKGLISLLVLKDAPESELFETYLERF